MQSMHGEFIYRNLYKIYEKSLKISGSGKMDNYNSPEEVPWYSQMENIEKITKELKLVDLEELYLSIGNNKYSANYIIGLIIKKEHPIVSEKQKQQIKSVDNNVIVEGIDKVKVNLANCCNPIPGDDIIGYITKGNGISVHRNSCHNLEFLDNRMINVKWNEKTSGKFLTSIVIYSKTNDKAMIDIIQKASSTGINVDSIKTVNKTESIILEVDIFVTGIEQLNKFIKELMNLKYITNVVRFIK